MKPKRAVLKASVEPTRDDMASFEGLGVAPPLPDVVVAEPELGEVEELDCFASFRKASKLFGPDSTALIENTMPAAQCPVCPQYPQIGAVSLIFIWKLKNSVALAAVGWNPDLNPAVPVVSSNDLQGLRKLDWVTV